MPWAVVHYFPGGPKDLGNRGGAPEPGRPGAGQICHAAGRSAGGWTIMAVHDSKESWDGSAIKFRSPDCSKASKGD